MTRQLLEEQAVAVRALRVPPGAVPLSDAAVLAKVTAPTLVLAQEDDPAHPVWVADTWRSPELGMSGRWHHVASPQDGSRPHRRVPVRGAPT